MRIIIEIENDEELHRLSTLLGEEGVEVRRADPAAGRDERRERLRAMQEQVHIDLPDDYHFDRDALYDRHG